MNKILITAVLLLSACATRLAPTPIDGRWNLVAVHCQEGKLGKLALDDRKGIESKQLEEFLVITGGKVEQHFLERKDATDLKAYCETVYSYQWTIEGGVLHSSGSTFQSREGKGGYQCYEPFPRTGQMQMPDLPFRLEADRFITSHQDIGLKDLKGHMRHECKSGSPVDHIYQKD